MITIIRRPDINESNTVYLRDIGIEDVKVYEPAIMSIDGSTDNTGVSIIRKSDGALINSCAFGRDKATETPVQYKVRFKRQLVDILIRNRMIDMVYYEEPFIEYANAAKNLLMLRTSVEELIIENEPHFDYLAHSEINNMKWKRMFLEPDKCPPGTVLQKAAVRKKLELYMPYMNNVSQDEIDSYCMGFVAITKINSGKESELESKKKVYPFQYNIEFIAANDDDGISYEFYDVYSGPKKILANGIKLCVLGKTKKFDKFVYEQMGSEDKVIIVKFRSDTHCDVILKHRVGEIAALYDYMYAVIWRKTRKLD